MRHGRNELVAWRHGFSSYLLWERKRISREASVTPRRLLLKHHAANAGGFQFVFPKASVALSSYIRKKPFKLPAAVLLGVLHKSLLGSLETKSNYVRHWGSRKGGTSRQSFMLWEKKLSSCLFQHRAVEFGGSKDLDSKCTLLGVL